MVNIRARQRQTNKDNGASINDDTDEPWGEELASRDGHIRN